MIHAAELASITPTYPPIVGPGTDGSSPEFLVTIGACLKSDRSEAVFQMLVRASNAGEAADLATSQLLHDPDQPTMGIFLTDAERVIFAF